MNVEIIIIALYYKVTFAVDLYTEIKVMYDNKEMIYQQNFPHKPNRPPILMISLDDLLMQS